MIDDSLLNSWYEFMKKDLLSGIASVVNMSGSVLPLPSLPLQSIQKERQTLSQDFQKVAQDFRNALQREVSKL